MNIASYSMQTSSARIAWLEYSISLDWTVLWNICSDSLIVNICMFYLFVNKYLYVTIHPMVIKHQNTTHFERTSYSI